MVSGSKVTKGVNRVLRGGSWINNARNCRSAQRNRNEPDNVNDNIGFRLSPAQGVSGCRAYDQSGCRSFDASEAKSKAPAALVGRGCVSNARRWAVLFLQS